MELVNSKQDLDTEFDGSEILAGLKRTTMLTVVSYFGDPIMVEFLLRNGASPFPINLGDVMVSHPPLFLALHHYHADLEGGDPVFSTKRAVDLLIAYGNTLGKRWTYLDTDSREPVTKTGWDLVKEYKLPIQPDASVLKSGYVLPLQFGWQLSGQLIPEES